MLSTKRTLFWIDAILVFLLVILLVGTPLVFTSLTRSVFEVNKLLLLRLVTLTTLGIWFFRYLLLKANGIDHSKEESISVFGFKWKKIGLEWPLFTWILLNLLSTIFSQNIRVALIGAYDRWEGIFTILNYIVLWLMFAKLVRTRKTLQILLAALVIPTVLSSIYGVLQSFGYDFMNWSVDPTKRVFACINNPVHFCAYVGMVVPICIGWILYLASFPKQASKKWLYIAQSALFIATTVIYYTQFLSFSRATWMGFVAAMTFFYLLVSGTLTRTSQKKFTLDFFFTALAMASFYLPYIFNLDEKSIVFGLIGYGSLVTYLAYSYRSLRESYTEVNSADSRKDLLLAIVSTSLVFVAFVLNIQEHLNGWYYPLVFAASAYFIRISMKANSRLKPFLTRLVIILIFARLQFVALSLTSLFIYAVLVICFYYLGLKGNPTLQREKKIWLTAFLAIFATVIFVPTIPIHWATLTHSKASTLLATNNAEGKVKSYQKDAVKGTARTSMWKSSIPWIKTYWILGTGPDTIKYMYPDFRRPEYGVLEGGHNFTPDRLHNEYLNTMATRGIPATLVYYGWLMVGWYVLMLNGLFRFKSNPYFYIAAGFLAAATVYLGQVLFNFGVVATLVLFYVVLGIGQAIVAHSDFKVAEDSE